MVSAHGVDPLTFSTCNDYRTFNRPIRLWIHIWYHRRGGRMALCFPHGQTAKSTKCVFIVFSDGPRFYAAPAVQHSYKRDPLCQPASPGYAKRLVDAEKVVPRKVQSHCRFLCCRFGAYTWGMSWRLRLISMRRGATIGLGLDRG
jgi:hypothetical protein